MQSANEELQSTNEELESSREELQSLNEELTTVNAELEQKLNELAEAYEDVTAMFNSTRIPMVFLDTDQKLKRFTRSATDFIHLIDSDVGRPIGHLKPKFEGADLEAVARNVLTTLHEQERDIRDAQGGLYRMKVLPSRYNENRIDGTVITFQPVPAAPSGGSRDGRDDETDRSA